jgi:DNA ligase-1
VIDGEILVWKEQADPETGEITSGPAPFALLQQRIGRKNVTKKILAEAPVGFIAYDLLEQDGQDVRELAQRERRARLEALLAGTDFRVSPVETAASWLEFARKREQSRERGVEGFMLKRWTPPTAPAAPRPTACGGSGRSIP